MRDTARAPGSSGVAPVAPVAAVSPPWPPVRELSDDELLRRLSLLVRGSRRVEAVLVAHIAEVDARRLYAREASPSMFAYCTGVLHLSEAESYLRISAARLSRQYPAVLALLADGALTLSAIARVAPHVTAENGEGILRLAAHRSKREVLELVAALAPKPDVEATIRRLPRPIVGSASVSELIDTNGTQELCPDRVLVRHSDGMGSSSEGSERGRSSVPQDAEPSTSGGTAPSPGAGDAANRHSAPATDVDGKGGVERSPAAMLDPAPNSPLSAARAAAAIAAGEFRASGSGRLIVPTAGASRQGTVEPLAPGRYKVQFTVGSALRAKLERLQELMQGSAQGGDLVAVIDVSVTEKLRRLEAKRLGFRLNRRKPGPDEMDRGNPTASCPPPASPTVVNPTVVNPTAVSPKAVSLTAVNPTAVNPTPVNPTVVNPTAASPTAVQPRRGARSRHIPAAIRRAVWARDEGRCRFAGRDGRRCPATRGLEFHHSHPFGLGGTHSVDSIQLMCRTHNLLLAEADYGTQKIRGPAPEGRRVVGGGRPRGEAIGRGR